MRLAPRQWAGTLLALCTVILGACSSLPPPTIPADSAHELTHWQLEGKLAVRQSGLARSAFFNWRNQTPHYQIKINGPFGQGSLWLERHPQGVTLAYNGEHYHAQSSEQLMLEQLGWSFPVENMTWWVRGLVAPGSAIDHQQRDEQGRLTELEQNQWRIQYQRYQNVAGLSLPYKLTAEHQDLKLTVILKKWQLSP